MKYDSKINKEKNKEEELNLERYIVNRKPLIPIIIKLQKPKIKLRMFELDTTINPELLKKLLREQKNGKKNKRN